MADSPTPLSLPLSPPLSPALTPADTALLAAATEARGRAHAPYSGFAVGAAVRTASGRVFTGSNVENGSYGLSMCAERVALFTARAAGTDPVEALAVVAHQPTPISPCGACRQVMAELAPAARVIMANLAGGLRVSDTRTLLPWAFEGPAE
jgi:cytidine deaminase